MMIVIDHSYIQERIFELEKACEIHERNKYKERLHECTGKILAYRVILSAGTEIQEVESWDKVQGVVNPNEMKFRHPNGIIVKSK